MNSCLCTQQIEDLRAEMVRTYEACNSFSDKAVVKISQELDLLLMKYTYCKRSKRHIQRS